LEFINRNEELEFLRALVPPVCKSSSLVILRAPSGFGKSTLTDQLVRELESQSVNVAVIDPSIRIRSGDARIYEGYFIQRCAADLAARADKNHTLHLKQFLSNRKWITAREKDHADVLRKYPSPAGIYSTAVEYFERLIGSGAYSEEKILSNDARFAVQICREFVQSVSSQNPLVSIVREAQHIDHESLRFFLIANKTLAGQHLILEYTSFNGRFDPDHEKVLLRELEDHADAHILDLLQLDRVHLQELIRKNLGAEVDLRSEYYLHWDGNLRAISEMRYRVALARRLDSPYEIRRTLSDLNGQIAEHLKNLVPLQRLMLALVLVNIEALDRHTLLTIAGRIDARSSVSERDQRLSELITEHRFLEASREGVRLQNEDIATAIKSEPSFQGLTALAQKGLRDFYRELIARQEFTNVAAAAAVRQTLRLCVLTNDTVGLVDTARQLTNIIEQSNDQSLYVDAIAEAISSGDLTAQEQRGLVDWAASLAYGVADFDRAASILQTLPQGSLDAYQAIMLACSHQEIGNHQAALELIATRRALWPWTDARLAAEIVEFLVLRAWNRIDEARACLIAILGNPEYIDRALLGYALRLSESIYEFPLATENLLQSVTVFDAHGLSRSKSYSELAAAMHLARAGRLDEASSLVKGATSVLQREVRDQQLILNDQTVVELLQDFPDFEACIRNLTIAMQTSCDDFSDVTLLNNLAISYHQSGRLTEAIDCVERILTILEDPTFGDEEILWGLAFTAMSIFDAANEPKRAREMRALPMKKGRQPHLYRTYWEFRFGQRTDADPKYQFMLRLPYHPLFLSHWLIDVEGLEVLRREPRLLLADTTSPGS
jgi:tetratricopeptide (TPR) repeat protein